MNRLRGLSQLARLAKNWSASSAFQQSSLACCDQVPSSLAGARVQCWAISRGYATAPVSVPEDSIASDLEQSTGLEREEVEGLAKGIDIFHEDWMDAPFGTETNPVSVTSYFPERIVGVPDPYDDSYIWWGSIKEGEPPRQIVEDGEFFVLKRLTDESGGHH